tara:strand:+ start:283 stop:1227 length:945 start_codon:yes stop_codon:yes gene_type:complete
MKLPCSLGLILLLATSQVSLAAPQRLPAHSLNVFAYNVLESFRNNDFENFYQSTVFALDGESFKAFLLKVKNNEIRDHLTNENWSNWEKEAKEQNKSLLELEEQWEKECLKQWRKIYNHLQKVTPSSIRAEAFTPILRGAEKEGIQWQTARLHAIEVFHEVSADETQFIIDGAKKPALYWESGLSYRLRFDQKSRDRSFRLSTQREGPVPYLRGVTREESGHQDLVVSFNTSPLELYYFCPRKEYKGMGNHIHFSSGGKHPKRNVMVTFAYGQKLFSILLRDCLPLPPGMQVGAKKNRWLQFERPVWIGPAASE